MLKDPSPPSKFTHRAAGRSAIAKLNEYVLIKTSTEREKEVYEAMPDPLKPFVPKFHGVADIYSSDESNLLLENLVAGMEMPCAMDLKVGQRQHTDEDGHEKVLKKTLLAKSTTSSTMGLRLHGLKAICYNMDKYQGRALDKDGLTSVILKFLPTAVLKQDALCQLKDLIAVLQDLPGCRFYTCSLLLVYDGAAITDQNVKVKMIDFACSTVPNGSKIWNAYQDPDNNFLQGLRQLETILNSYCY